MSVTIDHYKFCDKEHMDGVIKVYELEGNISKLFIDAGTVAYVENDDVFCIPYKNLGCLDHLLLDKNMVHKYNESIVFNPECIGITNFELKPGEFIFCSY